MPIYSGYVECGGSEADYEFESDEVLDAMGQLNYMLQTWILQIIPTRQRRVGDMQYREYTMRVTLNMTVAAASEEDAKDEVWDNIIDLGKQTDVLSIERA